MIESLLQELKLALTSLEQTNIFSTKANDSKIEEICVKYLKFKGYTVVLPRVFEANIKNLDDLIKYFYTLRNSNHPEKYAISYNLNKDRSIAKKFIESRMQATGCSKEYALNECGAIIRTIFLYEKEFNFNTKYEIGFYILGQDKLKWVTEKALKIMNNDLLAKEELESEEWRKKALAAQGTDDLGFDDLDELLARMKEEENGEKES